MTRENKILLIDLLQEYQAEVKEEYAKSTSKEISKMAKAKAAAIILMDRHIRYIEDIIDVLLYDM